MRARLFSKHGKLKDLNFGIADEAKIGRSTGNTIRLEPAGISGKHARIYFDEAEDCFVVEDLDSLNGTELDGMPVTQPERLGHLNVITFANRYDFIFQDLHLCSRRHESQAADDGQAEPAVPAMRTVAEAKPLGLPARLRGQSDEAPARTLMEQAPVGLPAALAGDRESAEAASAPPRYCLEVELDSGPRRYLLSEGENVIGRVADVEVRIEMRPVSRRHAVLTVSGRKVRLRDLGSANSTFVDDKKIEVEAEIEEGARIRFGNVRARLVLSTEEKERGGER